MLGLPHHIHAAALASDLVLLDVRANRYQALQGAVAASGASSVKLANADFALMPEAARVLWEAGVLIADCAPARRRLEAPRAELVGNGSDVLVKPSARDLFQLAAAMMKAGSLLAGGLPCSAYRYERLPEADHGSHMVVSAVRGLQSARLLVPTPRRCLPACTIAASFLRRRGLDVAIVFGVRSHPFDAHCWLEFGGRVIDDRLERVSAFTPIALGLL